MCININLLYYGIVSRIGHCKTSCLLQANRHVIDEYRDCINQFILDHISPSLLLTDKIYKWFQISSQRRFDERFGRKIPFSSSFFSLRCSDRSFSAFSFCARCCPFSSFFFNHRYFLLLFVKLCRNFASRSFASSPDTRYTFVVVALLSLPPHSTYKIFCPDNNTTQAK